MQNLVFGELGLFVAAIEDPEPVSIRREKVSLVEEIEDIIDRATDNPDAIIYGTFHTGRETQHKVRSRAFHADPC